RRPSSGTPFSANATVVPVRELSYQPPQVLKPIGFHPNGRIVTRLHVFYPCASVTGIGGVPCPLLSRSRAGLCRLMTLRKKSIDYRERGLAISPLRSNIFQG